MERLHRPAGWEENYLNGYIEAAIELVDAIMDKELFGQRDTLVLPILYNARHGIELALKFAIHRLVAAGVIKGNGYKRDHNIKACWERLHRSAIGDEKLPNTIAAFKPYIDSLSRIDSDGQELRYHLNRENDPSLAGYAVANLQLIKSSLRKLKILIDDLRYRTIDFIDERSTGSYTNHCSRTDLLTIATLMPSRDLWTTEIFNEKKNVVQRRYGLSNRQLSIVLAVIQKNREMRSILGMESNLLYLTDDEVIRIAGHWRRVHPGQKEETGLASEHLNTTSAQMIAEEVAARREVINAIEAELSLEALAELETLFYLGRDHFFVEHYEADTERSRKRHAVANDSRETICYLIAKGNFLQCLWGAAARLGRLSLAERLKGI